MFIVKLTEELAAAVGKGTRYADGQAAQASTPEQRARWIEVRDTLRKMGVEDLCAKPPASTAAPPPHPAEGIQPPDLVWVRHSAPAGRLDAARRAFEETFPYAAVADAGLPNQDNPSTQMVRYAVPSGFGDPLRTEARRLYGEVFNPAD